MTQLQPVLWTRGVLLAPQHLQAHDRFLEDSLQFKLSALAPGRWGFQHLEIDEQALAGGELRVRSASGVFPDGLLFDFPSSDSVPPPKPIHAAFAPDATDLVVYLAVPEYRDGSRNVENGAMGGSTRYVSDIVSRRDENTGTAEKKIEIARKNLRLLTANESHDGHATLPIARVVRTPSGTFTLDARYVPPLLNFAASAYLTTMTAELLARLSARSTDLSELRRQRNQSLADFGTAGIATFWLLYTVNSHLPLIKHLLETRRGHPAQLFEAMLALAGSLTTFSTDILPQNLATYDHADLTGCFGSLGHDVFKLLDTVLPSNCVTLPLSPHQESNVRSFAVTIGDDHYLESDQLFLAISADMRDADLLAAAPGLKISSVEHVKELVQKSQPGLALSFAVNPPSEVRVKPKYKYFRLSLQGEAWARIRKSRTFAVHGPNTFENANFELVVILPKS